MTTKRELKLMSIKVKKTILRMKIQKKIMCATQLFLNVGKNPIYIQCMWMQLFHCQT